MCKFLPCKRSLVTSTARNVYLHLHTYTLTHLYTCTLCYAMLCCAVLCYATLSGSGRSKDTSYCYFNVEIEHQRACNDIADFLRQIKHQRASTSKRQPAISLRALLSFTQSCNNKCIGRQGIGSSYVSALCPVVICPYLCTSDSRRADRGLRRERAPVSHIYTVDEQCIYLSLYIHIHMYVYIYIYIYIIKQTYI